MHSTASIIVADCDHANIEIERSELAGITDSLPWLTCRTETDVIEKCAEAHGLLIQYAPITAEVLERLPKLKAVVRYGVGTDTVDLDAAARRGVVVSNVPDYGTDEVSDHALGLLLCLERGIIRANRLIREGVWDFRRMRPVSRLQIQTIGVVGLGRIGRAFAAKACGLGMRVIGYDPYLRRGPAPDFVEVVSFPELLRRSDAVSIHSPLSTETRNLFSAKALAEMKPGAFLVNTARGAIVDEEALERALSEGRLGGAALDVASAEPLGPENPLLAYDNFICTPHMAWHSTESEMDLKRKAAEEMRRILTGAAPQYIVNGGEK